MSRNFSLREHMDAYSKRHKMMGTIAKDILGPYYNALKLFFKDIFLSSQDQYIVFVARRSICLAELFLIILWFEAENDTIAQDRLLDAWERATTDSTILSNTDDIARDLISGKNTKILLIDDVLVQGNGLNELLSSLESHIIVQLRHYINQKDIEHYCQSIVNMINIRVFVQNSKLSLVELRYQLKLRAEQIMVPKDWHNLSQRISNTIVATGLANATFIMGAELPAGTQHANAVLDRIWREEQDSADPAVVIYHDQSNALFDRYYWGRNHTTGVSVKYYCSLRIICNSYSNTLRFMPFVFLPELSQKSYQMLKNNVFQKWRIDTDALNATSETDTSRLEYEAMILHLSESLLVSWMEETGISLDALSFDKMKVSLNYAANRSHPKITKEQLNRLTDREYLFSSYELYDLLDLVTQDASPLGSNFGDPEENTRFDSQTLDLMKDQIYQMKLQELIESYRRFISMPPDRGSVLGFTLADHSRNNWNIRIEDFIQRMQSQISRITLSSIVNNLLTSMDYGYATLRIRQGCKSYTQVLRMGERALFIWPMRYDKYLPVLTYLQQVFGSDPKNLSKPLSCFLEHEKQIGILKSEKDTDILVKELIKHLIQLQESGQSLDDWDIRYEKPAVFYIYDKEVAKRIRYQYLEEQLLLMEENSEKRRLFNDCLEFYPS